MPNEDAREELRRTFEQIERAKQLLCELEYIGNRVDVTMANFVEAEEDNDTDKKIRALTTLINLTHKFDQLLVEIKDV